MVSDEAAMHAVTQRLDETRWRAGRRRGSVEVSWGRPAGSPVIGYRTTSVVDAPVGEVVRFLGAGLLEAFEVLNRHFAFGHELAARTATGPRIVRTGFALPRPLAPREFVHGVVEGVTPAGDHVIAYVPHDAPDLPVHAPGWVRCPIEPSGQRVRPLDDGRTRVEHLMTYSLGGRIPRWAQDRLFHHGHLGAYVDEWTRLVDHLGGAGSDPVATRGAA